VVLQFRGWAGGKQLRTVKDQHVTKCYRLSDLGGFYGTSATENGHGIWNMECQQSLYRAGLLETVSSELLKYMLDLEAIKEVRWDTGSSRPVEYCIHFSMKMGSLIIS
jgi:hypothetical protein